MKRLINLFAVASVAATLSTAALAAEPVKTAKPDLAAGEAKATQV